MFDVEIQELDEKEKKNTFTKQDSNNCPIVIQNSNLILLFIQINQFSKIQVVEAQPNNTPNNPNIVTF